MMGNVSFIQRFSVGDGPGIRTTVFLKGCPLYCAWCHNPEAMSDSPVLLYRSSLCTACGKCVVACENGVHTVNASGHTVDFKKCVKCGKCVNACLNGALEINGIQMSCDEIVSEVTEDKDFYTASNGGVTISGGEPLMQADFCRKFARKCYEKGINVLIDTSAAVDFSEFEKIIDFVDDYYIDLKAATEEDYKRLTGGSLKTVLSNIKRLYEAGKNITIRIPVIPNHNDSIEYMKKCLSCSKIRA